MHMHTVDTDGLEIYLDECLQTKIHIHVHCINLCWFCLFVFLLCVCFLTYERLKQAKIRQAIDFGRFSAVPRNQWYIVVCIE